MKETRVLFVHIPRLLADLLEEELGHQEGFEIVGRTEHVANCMSDIERKGVHVAIFGIELNSFRTLCDRLLRRDPGLCLFSVGEDGHALVGCRLRMELVPFGEASPSRIVSVVQQARAH